MSKTKNGHTCEYCNKEFRENFNYVRHIRCCQFLSKSTRERNNDIEKIEVVPSNRELLDLIQNLYLRMDRLEKENGKLKHLNNQKKKLSVAEYLNDLCKPSIMVESWIESLLNTVEKTLDFVFESDLLTGMKSIIDNGLNDFDRIPFATFESQPNVIYRYDERVNEWTKSTHDDFNKILSKISYHFIVEFVRCWYNTNKTKIDNDEHYKQMYQDYYLKILGGNRLSADSRNNRVRQYFISKIKQKL